MSVATTQLRAPFTEGQVRALKAGDAVQVSGVVYTGRDRLHAYLAAAAAPVSLQDGAIYHCGPIVLPVEGGWRIVAAGPTTSARENGYMPTIIARHGVRVIMGKGGMDDATRQACRQYGCVYLQVVGGAAASLAQRVGHIGRVFFLDEFGATEAMWELTVKELPAVVGVDSHGANIYERVRRASEQKLRDLLANTSAVATP